jgi:hypothetical protein
MTSCRASNTNLSFRAEQADAFSLVSLLRSVGLRSRDLLAIARLLRDEISLRSWSEASL